MRQRVSEFGREAFFDLPACAGSGGYTRKFAVESGPTLWL